MQSAWHAWILNTVTLEVRQRHGFEPYETADPNELVYEYEFIYDANANEVPL